MPKNTKQIRSTYWTIFAVAAGITIIYLLTFLPKFYAIRLVECPPKNLLPTLEKVFKIKFPDSISETRTAKSIAVEGDHNYIVKFVASPNDVDKFLRSLPDKSFSTFPMNRSTDYNFKKPAGVWRFIPRWFTQPIKEGTVSLCNLDNMRTDIYIDTSDKEKFIVYIYGFYSQSDEEL